MIPATYGGQTFKERKLSHEAEVAQGVGWLSSGSNSEYMRLRHVSLYRPSDAFDTKTSADEKLFLDDVTAAELASGCDAISEAFASAGVDVNIVDSALIDDRRHPNAVFQRDVSWATPSGAVVGRMAGEVRGGEERAITASLAGKGVPIALTIRGDGTLEGADCLWLRPDRVLCGVGKRTNSSGCRQLEDWLARDGVQLVRVPVPIRCQHLLGAVQIVSPTRAFVRNQIAAPVVVDELRAAGYDVIEVPEHPDVTTGMAFNFVTIAPNTAMMPRSTWFAAFLERHHVEVAAQIDMTSHIKAGGGLACTTGILSREIA